VSSASSDVPVQAALDGLREYLFERRPAAALADSLPVLLDRPPETVAADIRGWVIAKSGASAARDLPPVVERLRALSELDPTRDGRVSAYVRRLCDAVSASARPGEAAADASRSAGTPAPHRLTLVLDRLDALKGSPAAAPGDPAREQAVASAVLAATSPAQLESELEALTARGVVAGAEDAQAALQAGMPGRWPLEEGAETPAAVRALRQIVVLAPDPDEALRRFGRLVDAAIEEFNRGTLGKSAHLFGLAEELLAAGAVVPARAEGLRSLGHERLDLDRLRRLVESPDRSEFPPAVLRFFRVFAPETLLDKLRLEPRRERRRMLIAFLQTHGGEGRKAAFARLARLPEDEHDFFLVRNLVHLLCTIPRGGDAPGELERELARVVRLLVPENPPFLLKEVLTYLEQTRHPISEQVLTLFLRTLEEGLLTPDPEVWEEDRRRWLSLLDRTASVLASYGSARTWDALVEHGLRGEVPLGDTGARLCELARKDLSRAPEVVNTLVEATRAALPPGLLGRVPPAQGRRVLQLVTALAGTRATAAREMLVSLAARFPQHAFGQRAADAIAAQDASPDAEPDASLSGNLDVYALPTLLQNLSEMRATGALSLLDAQGRRAAMLALDGGLIRGARYGSLAGEDAIYQLLERPFPGTFAFVHQRDVGLVGETSAPLEVTGLVLEGLRRQDDLKRFTDALPGDARLEPTDQSPTAVPEESDIDLVTALWEKAVSGATPLECEQSIGADSFRVRRGLAHWVDEGSLKVRPAS
jgi:hypothetical protein